MKNKIESFPVMLYHGTTRNFTEHKLNKSRTVLNDNYQGDWLCYSESKDIAFKYANAARNQNFDKELFLLDMKDYFSDKGISGQYVYKLSLKALEIGSEKAFDEMFEEYAKEKNIDIGIAPREFNRELTNFDNKYNLDINDFFDLLANVEYSKVYEKQSDSLNEIFNFFNNTINQVDYHSIELHKRLGFKRSVIQPQVYCAYVTANKVLYTKDREKAKSAKEKGYDMVVYSGHGCVENEREILIANSNQIKLVRKILQHTKIEPCPDDMYSSIHHISFEEVDLKSTLSVNNNEIKRKKPKIKR